MVESTENRPRQQKALNFSIERIMEITPRKDSIEENSSHIERDSPDLDIKNSSILELHKARITALAVRNDQITPTKSSQPAESAFKKYVPSIMRPNYMLYGYPILYAPPKGMYTYLP